MPRTRGSAQVTMMPWILPSGLPRALQVLALSRTSLLMFAVAFAITFM